MGILPLLRWEKKSLTQSFAQGKRKRKKGKGGLKY